MPKLIDLTNKKFGHLTVIKRAEKNTSSNHPQWECQCDCGNPKIIIVAGSHLRSGHTTSCGCVQKQAARNNTYKDITGQRFDNLIALENIGSNAKGNALWKCKCNCGNIITVSGVELRRGHTKSCGCIQSFGEQKIIQILLENNILFTNQKTFDNCRFENTNALAKFDFYVNEQYIIEYDGKQHYNEGGWEEDFSQIYYRDRFKDEYCKQNNIPLIRIPYTHYNDLCLEDLQLETTKYRVV